MTLEEFNKQYKYVEESNMIPALASLIPTTVEKGMDLYTVKNIQGGN